MIETKSRLVAVGDVFGRYVVLGIFREQGSRHTYARVQCSCGSPPRYSRLDGLRNGKAQSCGCLHREVVTKHGAWNTPLFKVWKTMVDRCTNPKNHKYERYGQRGISVCKEWLDYHTFAKDMSHDYKDGLTIDRIDNDGNYEPGNCRWSTTKQQNRNYSRNLILEHDGKRMCVVDWAAEIGVPASALYYRVQAGWSVKRILTTPSAKVRR